MNAIRKHRQHYADAGPVTVPSLSFAGQMVVWGLRLLAAGQRTDINVSGRIIEGFRKCDAGRAGGTLILLSDVLFRNLTRNLEINCPCNPQVGSDEILLLEVMTSGQCSDTLGDAELLNAFLTEESIPTASSLIQEFVSGLAEAGLLLRSFRETVENQESISLPPRPGAQIH